MHGSLIICGKLKRGKTHSLLCKTGHSPKAALVAPAFYEGCVTASRDDGACNAFRQQINLVSIKNTGLANLNLPSFLWLWKIAAWAMGGAIAFYLLLFVSGALMFYGRVTRIGRPAWLRSAHYIGGIIIVFLVILLLAIGIVGTVGYYGSLGHSAHLWSGLFVVGLICLSAWSANQINARNDWTRSLHITTNAVLFIGLAYVSWTGWAVVQKYL